MSSDDHIGRMRKEAEETAARGFAKDQLRSFVERIERLNEESKSLSDDKRDGGGMTALAHQLGEQVPVRRQPNLTRLRLRYRGVLAELALVTAGVPAIEVRQEVLRARRRAVIDRVERQVANQVRRLVDRAQQLRWREIFRSERARDRQARREQRLSIDAGTARAEAARFLPRLPQAAAWQYVGPDARARVPMVGASQEDAAGTMGLARVIGMLAEPAQRLCLAIIDGATLGEAAAEAGIEAQALALLLPALRQQLAPYVGAPA